MTASAPWAVLPSPDEGAPIENLDSTRTFVPREGEAPHLSPLFTWGPLRVVEQLGRGGFGEVYRAYEPLLKREVALKLRRADDREGPHSSRFIQEARRLAQVRHPNVLVVHGAAEHNGRRGLWTDLIRGKTLEQAVAEQGPFGASEAASIGISMCGAVAAVHNAGLVHRDIKASNVMRETGGRIVLMDFGSAADPLHASEDGGERELSGTPFYMAPELFRHQAPSPASDIYSLGVLLYRIVSGGYPVEAGSCSELIDKHRKGQVRPLRDARPELPSPFVQAIERALEPDPALRYPSAGAMEKALGESVGRPESARIALTGTSRFHRLAYAATFLVAIALGAVGIGKLRPGQLKADAALLRVEGKTETRLFNGALIHPGDALLLQIQGSEKMYVYVINEDEMGHGFLLFPAGLDLGNPLPAGVHRLPGHRNGKAIAWEVDTSGGKEEFLVVASRRALRELEHDVSGLPRAGEGGRVTPSPVGPASRELVRGLGGLKTLESASEIPAENRIPHVTRDLSVRTARNDGIWTWRIELENAGR
jgi:eukaryotic-like serine/threonine-protein kinase